VQHFREEVGSRRTSPSSDTVTNVGLPSMRSMSRMSACIKENRPNHTAPPVVTQTACSLLVALLWRGQELYLLCALCNWGKLATAANACTVVKTVVQQWLLIITLLLRGIRSKTWEGGGMQRTWQQWLLSEAHLVPADYAPWLWLFLTIILVECDLQRSKRSQKS